MEARLITVVSFMAVIGAVVFAHEFGHFIMAKKARIPVHIFALGFGPALLKFKRGETMYRLNLLPLGGYVQIAGMEPDDIDHPQGFNTKSPGWRIAILTAGAAMNLVLAFLIFCVVGMGWGVSTNPTSTISRVIPGKGADKADLRPGDTITGVGDMSHMERTTDVEKIRKFVAARPFGYVQLLIRRGRREFSKQVETSSQKEIVPKEIAPTAPPAGSTSSLEWTGRWFNIKKVQLVRQEIGLVGVVWVMGRTKRVGPLAAIGHGLTATVETTGTVILGLQSIVRGEVPVKDAVYGPLGIAQMVGEQAKTQFVNLLSMLGIISVVLAVMNLIPFPALDGGRNAFIFLEIVLGWFRRKPIDPRKEAYIHLAGFIILLILLVVLTANDLLRIVGSP